MNKREYLLTCTESDDEISMPSFNFWQSFRPAFDGLCLSEKGYLITWIMWYMFDNALPIGITRNHDKEWKLLRTFRAMIPELDKQKQKYLEYLKAKQQS